jgi:aminoglycoside phosphotransferase (APT) family kinase protein
MKPLADIQLPDEIGALVCRAAVAAGGADAQIAEPVELAPGEWGAGTYTVRLAGDLPAAWKEPLIVRVATESSPQFAAVAGGEAAWHEFLAARGIGVPPVLASDVEHGQLRGVVMSRVHAKQVVEAMAANPMDAGKLATMAGELLVRIHAVDIEGAPADLGPSDLVAALADGAAEYGRADEYAWLEANRPRTATTLGVCHGNMQLAQVRVDPDDLDGAVVTTWTSVAVGPRERDVSQTALSLWCLPYLATRRSDRVWFKMLRDGLVDEYRKGYEQAAGVDLDNDLLAYWTAVHTLAYLLRVERAAASATPDPWDPVNLVPRRDSFAKNLRSHFWRHAKALGKEPPA